MLIMQTNLHCTITVLLVVFLVNLAATDPKENEILLQRCCSQGISLAFNLVVDRLANEITVQSDYFKLTHQNNSFCEVTRPSPVDVNTSRKVTKNQVDACNEKLIACCKNELLACQNSVVNSFHRIALYKMATESDRQSISNTAFQISVLLPVSQHCSGECEFGIQAVLEERECDQDERTWSDLYRRCCNIGRMVKTKQIKLLPDEEMIAIESVKRNSNSNSSSILENIDTATNFEISETDPFLKGNQSSESIIKTPIKANETKLIKNTHQTNLIEKNQNLTNKEESSTKLLPALVAQERVQQNAKVISTLKIEFDEKLENEKSLLANTMMIPEQNTNFQSSQQDRHCEDGFRFNVTSKKCEDIDECSEIGAEEESICDYKCQNQIGSYECICPKGYDLVNGDCVDVDECVDAIDDKGGVCLLPTTNSKHEQSLTNQLDPHQMPLCLNLRGSYRCAKIICPAGFSMMDSR